MVLKMLDNDLNNEKVARCDGIATQRATNDKLCATPDRNTNATNNLKALAGAVLQRNTLRTDSATDTPKHAQQRAEKITHFVAQSCADFGDKYGGSKPEKSDLVRIAETAPTMERIIHEAEPSTNAKQPVGDWRRHCRQCMNHRPVFGRDRHVIRCSITYEVSQDDLPRHCADWKDNRTSKPYAEPVEPYNSAENVTYPSLITCWSPAGNPILVLAKDAEHEAFLLQMNPKP